MLLLCAYRPPHWPDTYIVRGAQGVAMIPEEVKPPDPEPSANNEETQPEDSSEQDPDTARGAAFKRMFPDVPGKTERPKTPSK